MEEKITTMIFFDPHLGVWVHIRLTLLEKEELLRTGRLTAASYLAVKKEGIKAFSTEKG